MKCIINGRIVLLNEVISNSAIIFDNTIQAIVQASEIDVNSVWDEIDNQTKDYLQDLGIDEISFGELFDLSPTRVIEFIIKLSFNSGIKVFHNIFQIILKE